MLVYQLGKIDVFTYQIEHKYYLKIIIGFFIRARFPVEKSGTVCTLTTFLAHILIHYALNLNKKKYIKTRIDNCHSGLYVHTHKNIKT